MSFPFLQNGFLAGELSPAVYGRTDMVKYHLGATTMRNFFVGYRGGAYSRPGLAYVGICKQSGSAAPPRDIPFQFNNYQGFELEFGDNYMRVKSNGAYVTEAAKTVVSITQASPAVITVTGHGWSNGDWVFGSISGMNALNGLTWIVENVTTNTFQLTDLFGNTVNSTLFNSFTSGTFSRIYTLATPYAAIDLPYLKFVQSADTMTLDCVNPNTTTGLPAVEYPSYNLVRTGAASYTLTKITYASSISAPTNCATTAQSSTTTDTYYSYCVTAVDANGNESIASNASSVKNNNISVYAGSNTTTWTSVAGAKYYNVYKATPSYGQVVPVGVNYGYCGEAFGTSFVDTNITADFTQVPPTHQNPFARGQIIGVTPTAGGSEYTQAGIAYSITTSTGTGFAGAPIVLSGAFVGFVITNNGQNYAPTDTITITGGGSATAATGTFTASGTNVTNGKNFVLNGTTWTFTTGSPTGNQISVGASSTATFNNMLAVLAASSDPATALASYTGIYPTMTITYKTVGTPGNYFSLSAGTSTWTMSGATLMGGTDSGGATASLTIGPQTGTYPAVPSYIFQRAVQANTLNAPDDYFMSQPGKYLNMDSSIPITDGDAIIGNPWAQQINGIQFIQPMLNAAVIFTGGGLWLLSGGGGVGTPFTPTSQQATPQEYNGCSSTVPPILIGNEIVYIQSLGSVVRDASYDFFRQRVTSVDITVLSSHLFEGYQLTQWAYAQNPYYLIWGCRNDGTALSLTFIKEQEVQGWARHDTNGLFVGVSSITEPPVNAVYWIVKRFLNGAWYYVSERFDNRLWNTVEDSFCVDAGLSYPQPAPNATLTPSAASGTITLTASAGVFSSGSVGSVVRVGGGIMDVTAYTSSTVITAVVRDNQAITEIVPNDPNNTPIPQTSGNWTITVPTKVVTGLNHLIGLEVAILADGGVVNNQTVVAFADGTVGITLPQAASSITVGLPFLPQLQSMYIDPPSQGGTAQGKRSSISQVTVRVENTRGISVGVSQPDQATTPGGGNPVWTGLIELKMRNSTIFAGQPVPLESDDFTLPVQGTWSEHSQVAIQQSYCLPANISAILYWYQLGDTSS